jgi:hypothetical protein
MPAAPSALTGPAIGQLLTLAQAAGTYRGRLLPVLAAVPDPRARRGVRLTGETSIAAAPRSNARRPNRPPQTIMNC